MAEVTMVENKHRKAPTFWGGFFLGVVLVALIMIYFWFIGWIDVFPAEEEQEEAELGATTAEEPVISKNDVDNTAINSNDEDIKVDEEESTGTAINGATAVLARNVDESANPIGETSTFSSDDDRVYIILTLDSDARTSLGSTKLTVTWNKNSSKLSEFSTDLSEGQSKVFFYTSNPGVGDYTVEVTAGSKTVVSESFSVL